MVTWKKLVTQSDGNITQNTLGSAASIDGVITGAQGGFGASNMPAYNAADNGILVKESDGWKFIEPSTENTYLKWDGASFSFGTVTVGDGGTQYLTVDDDASFNSLTVEGTLSVAGAIFWTGQSVTTTANVIELNYGGSALGSGDTAGISVDIDGSGATDTAGLIYKAGDDKWVAESSGGTETDLLLMHEGTTAPDSSVNHGVGSIFINNGTDIYIQTDA
jgi:hypothetical protein